MNQSGLLLFVDLGGLWLLLLLAASSSAPLAPRASSTIIRIVSPSSQKEERKKTRKKIHTIKSLSPAPEHLILLGVGGLLLPDKTNTNKTHGRTSQYLLFFLLWPPTPHGTCFLLLSVGELNPIKETIKAHTIRRRNNTVRWRIPLMHHQMQHTGCVCVCAIKVYSLSRLCQQEKRIKRMCIHTGGYKVIA